MVTLSELCYCGIRFVTLACVYNYSSSDNHCVKPCTDDKE